MKPVIQEETTGCGIAACAALAGVSYKEAKQLAGTLGIRAADKALWSDTQYVRRLLAAFDISASSSETAFTSWDALPDRALLAIKWHLEQDTPFWHWVVFVRENGEARVLDSKQALKSNTRKDFGRIKPKWFIEVTG
ncbi:hypothetical protein [Marinobacterium stanieri]|uniref:hypothetical protein n=1 Tax=Marinobacterium stanieri TaxID=49186 RepID=UPI0002558F36|nr:hypothetical protein [Marinobacterium stanieri]